MFGSDLRSNRIISRQQGFGTLYRMSHPSSWPIVSCRQPIWNAPPNWISTWHSSVDPLGLHRAVVCQYPSALKPMKDERGIRKRRKKGKVGSLWKEASLAVLSSDQSTTWGLYHVWLPSYDNRQHGFHADVAAAVIWCVVLFFPTLLRHGYADLVQLESNTRAPLPYLISNGCQALRREPSSMSL